MSHQVNQQLMLAKLETGYGNDSTPTAAANAIYCVGDIEATPLQAEYVERPVIRPDGGNVPHLVAGAHVAVNFAVEFASSGAAGTPPAFGSLLRACGMAEIVTAGVNTIYIAVAQPSESLTLWFWKGGTVQKVTGWRGTWSLEGQAQQAPTLRFQGLARYVAPEDTALPANPAFAAFQPPVPISAGSTTFTIGTFAGVLNRIAFQLGAQPVYRNRPNHDVVHLNPGQPSGEVTIDMPTVAQLPVVAQARTGALQDVYFVNGSAAGARAEVTCIGAQIAQPAFGEDQGRRTMSLRVMPRGPLADRLLLRFS